KDGLRIHDAVREAIALTVRAQDPQKYRSYRRAAYRHFMSELRTVATPDLWWCTADLLYMLENRVVREAFFPTGAQEYSVEPAESGDKQQIVAIIPRHEGPAMCKSLVQWWNKAPEPFMVARDRKGTLAGFYYPFGPGRYRSLRIDDPVVGAGMDHLDENSVPRQQ